MKTILIFLICFAFSYINASAQTTINQVFKTIKPQQNTLFNFISIDNQSKILAYGSNITNIYDENWKVIETHNAGQNNIQYGTNYASRSFEYNTSTGKYSTTQWVETKYSYTTQKYTYSILQDNYMKFYNGEIKTLYYLQGVQDVFLDSHSISKYNENLIGIAGELSYVSNSYVALTTNYNIVDWDGNIICKITLPYYMRSGSCQILDVKSKCYIIVTAYNIYPKDIKKDCDLYAKTEYTLSSKEIESGFYHHFIYEYNTKTNAISMLRSEKTSASRTEVARYDLNGTKLTIPQKGINIVLYSDGSSEKRIEK